MPFEQAGISPMYIYAVSRSDRTCHGVLSRAATITHKLHVCMVLLLKVWRHLKYYRFTVFVHVDSCSMPICIIL